MTDANSGDQASGDGGRAMNDVLQAERQAAGAVAECEQRADEILKAAQARAQRLVKRADQRITVIQMRCNHRIDSVIKTMEKQQSPADAAHPAQLGEQVISAVVAALAAQLTGAEDEPPGERRGHE